MKKKSTVCDHLLRVRWVFTKHFLAMKLSFLLCFLGILNISAGVYSQSNIVSVAVQNISVRDVLRKVEDMSQYRFLYNDDILDLDRKITLDVQDSSVEFVLDQIFAQTNVSYQVLENNLVVLVPAEVKEQIRVTGAVRDERTGGPLPGVTVLVKGTTMGTVSDAEGNYSIAVPSANSILVFSFVGYIPVEIAVGDNREIMVSLEERIEVLEEFVVVGYGTVRRRDVTGAIASISEEDLNQGAITNPLQQMAGRAAGVVITQVGSEPGSSPGVRIRGITSLIGGSDPLVVIDGIQSNLYMLNQLPPSEIASIDILKDASATAIYGSRGAAGVILVTTKRSKSGTSEIEFSSTASLDIISNQLEMFTADEWREQRVLWGVPAITDHGASTDWFGLLTRNGSTMNHSIALGGGTDNFNYRASVSAILQNGVVINSNNENFIGRLQATQRALNDRVVITGTLSGGTRNNVGSPGSIGRAAFTSNLISNTYVSRPTDPVMDADGEFFTDDNVFQYINPYAVAQTVVNEFTSNNLFGSLRAEVEIFDGFRASWFGSWRKQDGHSGYFLPERSTVTAAIDNNGIANINNWHEDEKLTDISINYNLLTGNHRFDAIAVYEWQRQAYNGNFTQMRGFINDITTFNALQNGDLSRIVAGDISSYRNSRNTVSLLGRINYAFRDRYLLTFSMRRDGSSVFGLNYKWGNFPSAAFAWRLSDEAFMDNFDFLSDLKIRIGYGVTGNQQGLHPQRSRRLVSAAGQTYFGGNLITNFAISQNGNDDLRWETKAQLNFGVDFSVFQERLFGSVDVYRANTENLLFYYTVPLPPFPFPTIVANVGSLRNEGIDINLSGIVLKTDDISFTLSGNLSLLRNKILDLSGSISGVPVHTDYVPWGINSFLIEGQPIGTFNILQHAGKTALNEELVRDIDGSGLIDGGSRSPDRVISGSALPTHTYAISPRFTFRNFDISMLFRGQGGNKIFNSIRQSFSLYENLGKSNLLRSAQNLRLFSTRYASDLWLEDGAFLRFENLTLGYRFNNLQIRGVSDLRVTLTAQNLAVFTRYTGLDPELNISGGGHHFGSDGGIFPRVTSVSLGVNLIIN